MTKKIIMTIFIAVLLVGCGNGKGNEESGQVKKPEDKIQSSSSEEKGSNNENIEGNGMPYINPQVTYELSNVEIKNPWDTYNLLDSVIKLKKQDMKGATTFINGEVYSYIDSNGLNDFAVTLPVGNREPEKADLYMSETNVTKKLKTGDVIALEGTTIDPTGSIQKIDKIEITNHIIHITTICPQPQEIFGTPALKEGK